MGYLLDVKDVLDISLRSLWGVLRNPGLAPLDAYLRAQLRPATQAALDAWIPRPAGLANDQPDVMPPFALKSDVVFDLNQAMVRGSFWDPVRFAGVELTTAARKLRSQAPTQGAAVVRLNRLLLESAYPLQIRHHAGSILTRWSQLKRLLTQQQGMAANDDLQRTFKQVFDLFDKNVSRLAQIADSAGEAVASAPDGSPAQRSAIGKWREAHTRVMFAVEDYKQAVEVLAEGFRKKHPQSSSKFTLVKQVLDQIHQASREVVLIANQMGH